MTGSFRIVRVSGRWVRVDLGNATLDVQIETVGPGRYRMVMPDEIRIQSAIFTAVVSAAIRAYKETLEQKGEA